MYIDNFIFKFFYKIFTQYFHKSCQKNISDFVLFYGDLTDSSSIINLIKKTQPNEIYNLAAQSHVQVSFESPEYTANADALGALRILEAIRFNNLEKKTTSELLNIINSEDKIVPYVIEKSLDSIKSLIDESKNENFSIESISKKVNSKIKSIELETSNNEIPRNLLNNIFKTSLGKIIVFFANEQAFFAKVNEIIITKNQEGVSQTILLNNQLKSAFGNEIIKTKNISTNENLLNALLDQY